MRTSPLWIVIAALVGLSSCALLQGDGVGRVGRDNAAWHLREARTEVAGSAVDRGVRRLVKLREVVGLTPEERVEVEDLLRRTIGQLFDDPEGERYDSDDYFELYELELPPTLRATAGVLAADRLFDEGHPVRAWKQIRDVDRELANHGARSLAGEVLGKIGIWLIQNDATYYFFFSYRERGVSALEYLVVQYPLATACPQAYVELSQYYEDTFDLDYAIERLEDLLLYHPGSAYSIHAEARLPFLRMERLHRMSYDRSELQQAAAEIERWLRLYPDHELEEWVRALRVEAQRRLAENDLVHARYYRRVGSDFGTRIHAQRALGIADAAGISAAAEEARALLAELPQEAPEGPLPQVELLEETRP